jgi:lipopolysaccharide/colanic/teichoic acid biosynthesis glycosyltransferase
MSQRERWVGDEVRSSRPDMKRVSDLLIGVPLALVTIPVVVLLMFGAMVTFRASPLFVQTRIGRQGREFSVYKIRTLHPSVCAGADKYQLRTEELTRFGAAVRACHLDELPQLWNVVFGSMSMVGHRPEMPHLAEHFSAEQRQVRDAIRPGLTGPWQLSEHSDGLMSEHPEYDLWYAENRSVLLDLRLMALTPLFIAGKRRFVLPGKSVLSPAA